jgi:hypothetical protein
MLLVGLGCSRVNGDYRSRSYEKPQGLIGDIIFFPRY